MTTCQYVKKKRYGRVVLGSENNHQDGLLEINNNVVLRTADAWGNAAN